MIIRKFKDKDRTALVDLWKAVFPDDPPHNAPQMVIDQKLAIDDHIFVVDLDGKIVGACIGGYDGHRGWLYAVAVSPDHRRKNIGTQLITGTMTALKELGCNKVNLQIRAENTAVAEFYKSLGFSVEERMSMGIHI